MSTLSEMYTYRKKLDPGSGIAFDRAYEYARGPKVGLSSQAAFEAAKKTVEKQGVLFDLLPGDAFFFKKLHPDRDVGYLFVRKDIAEQEGWSPDTALKAIADAASLERNGLSVSVWTFDKSDYPTVMPLPQTLFCCFYVTEKLS